MGEQIGQPDAHRYDFDGDVVIGPRGRVYVVNEAPHGVADSTPAETGSKSVMPGLGRLFGFKENAGPTRRLGGRPDTAA